MKRSERDTTVGAVPGRRGASAKFSATTGRGRRGMLAALLLAMATLHLSSALADDAAATAASDASSDGPVLTVAPRGNASLSAFIDSQGVAKPDWVVLLFAGDNGAIAVGSAGPRRMKGNFVISTAKYWPQHGMAAVEVDAPSDYANGMTDTFRLGDAHAQDVGALVDALRKRFPGAKIALVGTSRGTISVGGLLLHNPALADAYVLTSPVTIAGRGGPGLSGVSWPKSPARVLVVSDRNDGCVVSPFWSAQKMAEANGFTFLAVSSDVGDTRMPGACGPQGPHGYLGIEGTVLDAISGWLHGQPLPAQAGT